MTRWQFYAINIPLCWTTKSSPTSTRMRNRWYTPYNISYPWWLLTSEVTRQLMSKCRVMLYFMVWRICLFPGGGGGKRAFRTLASFAGHTESFCAADLFKNPIISLDLLWNDYVRAMYYCILQWQKEGKEGKIYIYIFSMYLGQIPKKKSTEVLKAKSRSNCQYLGPKNEWNSV